MLDKISFSIGLDKLWDHLFYKVPKINTFSTFYPNRRHSYKIIFSKFEPCELRLVKCLLDSNNDWDCSFLSKHSLDWTYGIKFHGCDEPFFIKDYEDNHLCKIRLNPVLLKSIKKWWPKYGVMRL